jgi:hypothetical protein
VVAAPERVEDADALLVEVVDDEHGYAALNGG